MGNARGRTGQTCQDVTDLIPGHILGNVGDPEGQEPLVEYACPLGIRAGNDQSQSN